MRNPLLVVVVSMALFAAMGCSAGTPTATPAPTPAAPVEGQLHRAEHLSYGDGITVIFQGVSQDSRCPKNVVCVWAGEAYVQTTMTLKGGEPADHTMTVTPGGDTWATYGGYLVTLTGLEPDPPPVRVEGQSIDYVAHFRIEVANQ